MRKSFFLALFFEMISQTSTLLALQTYPLVTQQKTTIPISQDQQNRIAIANDRIHQIFGAEGSFDVQNDDVSGQIFVRCLNSQSTKPQTITIVTESGLTQDLKLLPQKIEFQSILLKPIVTPEKLDKSQPSYLQHLVDLMTTMMEGKKRDAYKVTALQHAERSFKEPLVIKNQLVYWGEEAEGYIYHLKNEGEETLSLKEKNLALPQDLALAVTQNSLPPGEETYLFVITKIKRFS